MGVNNFISKNKLPLVIVGVLGVSFIGYKYISKRVKGKRDQERNITTDINAAQHGDYNPSVEAPAQTGDNTTSWGRGIFDLATLGIFKK